MSSLTFSPEFIHLLEVVNIANEFKFYQMPSYPPCFKSEQEQELFKKVFQRPSRLDKTADTKNYTYYIMSLVIVAIGCTFAAIPAYRIFCEQTSFGGLTQVAKDFEKIANMKKCEDRLIRVQFNSDVPSSMRWEFKPQQHEVEFSIIQSVCFLFRSLCIRERPPSPFIQLATQRTNQLLESPVIT